MKKGYDKSIWYEFQGIESFRIIIDNDANTGLTKSFIKWSIEVDGNIKYFMIDSLNPLRILGGIAAFAEYYYHFLWEAEEELEKFVDSLDSNKIIELSAKAIIISHKDSDQMRVPPDKQINLYTPNVSETIQKLSDSFPKS